MATAAKALHRSDESEALEFLARDPFERVMLEWILVHDRSTSTRDRIYIARDEQANLRGIAFFGRQVLVSADTGDAIDALAKISYVHREERAIVGEARSIERFWSSVRAWHRPPRIVRKAQPLFVLEKNGLREPPAQDGVTVRRGTLSDIDEITRNSAAMIEQELGYDPRTQGGDFDWNIRRMIERGWWWVGMRENAPVFFVHLGPYNDRTAQLQGVWTRPELRGTSIGTRALGQICRHLLEPYPTLSLYVNDFNEPAIRLYRRLGFRQHTILSTYLF